MDCWLSAFSPFWLKDFAEFCRKIRNGDLTSLIDIFMEGVSP